VWRNPPQGCKFSFGGLRRAQPKEEKLKMQIICASNPPYELPWTMDDKRPAKESGPKVFMASIIIARAPLPLNGFINAVGMASTKRS